MEANLKVLVNAAEVLIFILTFFAGYFIRKFFSEKHLRETEERAGKLLEESKKELETGKKSWSLSPRT